MLQEFLASNAGNLSYAAIQAANAFAETALPAIRFSGDDIANIKGALTYYKAAAGVGLDRVRNTVNRFRNRPRRTEPEPVEPPAPSKEDEQRRKESWRRQQAAKIGGRLPERAPEKPSVLPAEAGADQDAAEQAKYVKDKDEIRAAISEKIREKSPVAQARKKAEAKIRQTQEAIKRIRRIWRIVNIASGVTLVGLIVPFISMNGFLILGNWLRFPRVPKLTLPEIIIIAILNLILLSAILIVFAVFSLTVWASTPENWPTAAKLFAGEIWDAFVSLFK